MAGAEKAAEISGGTPKSYKCKDCKTSYQDVHAYAEHLESKQHIKGVMKNKYGEKYLEAKAKLETATNSSETILTKGTEKEVNSGSEESDDDVYPCEVCKKVCTGYVSYKLHLQGKKHHKALTKENLINKMKEKQILPLTEKKQPKDELEDLLFKSHSGQKEIVCELCNKPCTGPESYQAHLKSKGHMKKTLTHDMITAMDSIGLSHKEKQSVVSCEICEKEFSGPIPYLQHINSPVHTKQIEKNKMRDKNKDLVTTSEKDTKIYCKECGKTFSGPIPFDTHLNSSVHEKMKRKNSMLAEIEKNPELFKGSVEDEDSESELTLGCQVCHTMFSGPEAAKDHFDSDKHKKAVKKKAMFKKYKTEVKASQGRNNDNVKVDKLNTGKTTLIKLTENGESSDEFEVIPDEKPSKNR